MAKKKKSLVEASSRGKARPVVKENERKRKMYVLFYHGATAGFTQSLFAIDVPDPIPTTVDDVQPGPEPEPERVTVNSILRFHSSIFPKSMCCVNNSDSSRLYLFGGQQGLSTQQFTYPTDVFFLDLTTTVPPSAKDHPEDILGRVREMHSGKYDPIAFVAGRNIIVLSGRSKCPFTQQQLDQFEVYKPKQNLWKKHPPPPFKDGDIKAYAVDSTRHQVTIYHEIPFQHRAFYTLDLNSYCWKKFVPDGWTRAAPDFEFGNPSYFVGNTLYTIHQDSYVIGLKHLENYSSNVEELILEDDKYYLDVLKHPIPSPNIIGFLTHLGDKRFCFLQAGSPIASTGDPEDFNPHEFLMSVTLFDIIGDGESAKHLASAYYWTDPDDCMFIPTAAILV